MKTFKIFALGAVALLGTLLTASAKDLVILHTNDTHSLIEPGADGMGGVLQRKAIIDSVRAAEKNVVLVDAGDVVQGTLYFKYFKGDVEYPLMNMMDYDVRILGNHEFDNGLDELAKYYKDAKGARLSANYDFSNTPAKGIFEPYTIKKIDGKKIGFIGINIDPASLISKQNYEGLVYRDAIEEANKTAALLKKKGCDLVVAVTHIGYVKENEKPTDIELAEASKDIDIIIGGHSHTLLMPGDESKPHLFPNADGRPVLVVQTGKSGRYLGYIKVDLDKLKSETPADYDYQLIPVTDRFPEAAFDKRIVSFLEPYKARVDSVNNRVIAHSAYDLSNRERTGGYPNWIADFASWYGDVVTDSLRSAGVDIAPVDFAIMNVGGIRASMPKGDVTEGQILSTFPFANHMVITRVKGSDIKDALSVAARKGGEGVSKEVRVVSDADGKLREVYIDMEPLDPEREYNVMTIDYVAQGNDDLTGFGRGELLWSDPQEMSAQVMRYVNLLTEMGLPIAPDLAPRFVTAVQIP
ncbi:MAG: bifunctional metallophosphatase/5'-nucleotidase [Bacteroides sp.]|nr:bifunctional metallophosphatase/5'-nucleotidase [Bacteroides sp.]